MPKLDYLFLYTLYLKECGNNENRSSVIWQIVLSRTVDGDQPFLSNNYFYEVRAIRNFIPSFERNPSGITQIYLYTYIYIVLINQQAIDDITLVNVQKVKPK